MPSWTPDGSATSSRRCAPGPRPRPRLASAFTMHSGTDIGCAIRSSVPGACASLRASSRPDASRSAHGSNAPACAGPSPAPTPLSPCAAACPAAASRTSGSGEPPTLPEEAFCRVDDCRGGGRRMGGSCSRRLSHVAGASLPAVTPFPVAAHRTGRADFPHPALGRDPPLPPATACAGAASSGVERRSYTPVVTGSNPVPRTSFRGGPKAPAGSARQFCVMYQPSCALSGAPGWPGEEGRALRSCFKGDSLPLRNPRPRPDLATCVARWDAVGFAE